MRSVRDRLETRVLRTAMALPPRLQRLLAGRPDVRDGQTLAAEIQLMLRLDRIAGVPAVETLPLQQGRAELDRQSGMVGGRQPIGSIRELSVAGAAGELPARLYAPSTRLHDDVVPTLMFFHGGGMIYGGLASHDAAARHLAEASGVQVLAVDYRLAPEHPFPAAVDDCAAAYAWLVEHTADVGADPDRLAVGGDSAGAYLSATTAIRAAEQGLPLAFQLLVYPCTDFVETSHSRRLFAEGYFLTQAFIDLATEAFFPDEAARHDPLASIVRRESLPSGLAPAYVVTAGFDPLRDEGEAYARLLAEHGVAVESKRYEPMIHGFFNIVGTGREAPAYNREIAQRLADALR